MLLFFLPLLLTCLWVDSSPHIASNVFLPPTTKLQGTAGDGGTTSTIPLRAGDVSFDDVRQIQKDEFA